MKLMTAVATTLCLTAGVAMANPPVLQSTSTHPSLKHCEKEATNKSLKGEERTKFIKECQEASKPK